MNRKELVEKAKELGLEFASNISDEKLQAMVDENQIVVSKDMLLGLQAQIDALKENSSSKVAPDNTVNALVRALNHNPDARISKGISIDDVTDRPEKLIKALTLIRCKVLPMDPSKKGIKSEVVTVSNDLVGDLRYIVPYTFETHIPYFIYKVLKGKKVNIFDEDKTTGAKATGQTQGGFTTVDAYSIAVFPPLTKKQLEALAKKQKLRSDDLDTREDAILEEEVEKVEEIDPLKELGYNL